VVCFGLAQGTLLLLLLLLLLLQGKVAEHKDQLLQDNQQKKQMRWLKVLMFICSLLLLLLLQGKVAEHKDQLLQDISSALSTLLETPLKDMPGQLLLQVGLRVLQGSF
jgi:hypothetical protein